MDELFQALLI